MADETVPGWLRLATFLRKGPVYLWSYARWRGRRWAETRSRRPPAWPSDEDLGRALGLPSADPATLSRAARERVRAGALPRLLRDPAAASRIVHCIPEAVRAETVRRADEVLGRRFRARGREVVFPGSIDWNHCPDGNRDWTWDLNRHQYFPVLGRAYRYSRDERHARGLVDLLLDWMRANPPGVAEPRWRDVFEVGVRIPNWCWAHALILDSPSLDDAAHLEILRGLLGLGLFLERHLERHAWNNHLLLEAKGLATLALLHPELGPAERWRRDATAVLNAQIRRQVLRDGVHSERSTLYHEIIASELLEHRVVLELAGAPRGSPHAALVDRSLRGMARFLECLTRTDGTRPLLGDSSRGDAHLRHDTIHGVRVLEGAAVSLPPGPFAEATVWLLGAVREPPRIVEDPGGAAPERCDSAGFPEAGYHILRGRGDGGTLHMVFDCGPFCDPVVPSHGHADALSIDLAVGPSHVLIDPGMYSAHLGKRWRNHFRGTSAHNTVVIDAQDQTRFSGTRGVHRPARARLVSWSSSDLIDLAVGEHDGYRRLGGLSHRRLVLLWKSRWILLVDSVAGVGAHRHDLLFHLHPDQAPSLDCDTAAVVTRDARGRGLAILPFGPCAPTPAIAAGEGEEDVVAGPIQGWAAFSSGVREPAPVVTYRLEGESPVRFETLLVPLWGVETATPVVKRVPAFAYRTDGSSAGEPVAGRVAWPRGDEVFAVRTDAEPGNPRRAGTLRAGDLETDGLAAVVRFGPDGACEAAAVVAGTRIAWRRRELLRLEGETPADVGFEVGPSGEVRVHRGVGSEGTRIVQDLPPAISGS